MGKYIKIIAIDIDFMPSIRGVEVDDNPFDFDYYQFKNKFYEGVGNGKENFKEKNKKDASSKQSNEEKVEKVNFKNTNKEKAVKKPEKRANIKQIMRNRKLRAK
jgi:hypothetical protein